MIVLNKTDTPRIEPISVCMIVRDEEACLERALNSVKGWVREIVVVDTGSQDRTAAIAATYTDSVYHYQWRDSFAKARNYSISKATSEWLLFIDADEEIPESSIPAFRRLINGFGSAGWVTMRNWMPDGSSTMAGQAPVMMDGKWAIDFPAIRLVRNLPGVQFEGDIHEMLDPWVKQRELVVERDERAIIWHHGKLNAAKEAGKTDARLAMALHQADTYPCLQNFFNAAQEASRAEQWLTVVNQYNRAVALGQDIPGAIHSLAAYALVRLGQFQRASEMYLEILAVNPNDAAALDNLGIALHGLDKKEEAEGLFKAALARKLPLAAIHLYEMYTEDGRMNEAHKALLIGKQYCPYDISIQEKLRAVSSKG